MPLPAGVLGLMMGGEQAPASRRVMSKPASGGGNAINVKPLGARNGPGKRNDVRMKKVQSAYASARPSGVKTHIKMAESRKMAPKAPSVRRASVSVAPTKAKRPSVAAPKSSASVSSVVSRRQSAPSVVAAAPSGPPMAAAPKEDVNVFAGFGVTLAPSHGRAPTPDDDDMDEHQSMINILGSRLLQVKAAKAEAYGCGSVDGAIENIARTGDITLAMDFFPVLTQTLKIRARIQSGEESASSAEVDWEPTLAACLGLLPSIRSLLESRYESYNVCGLELVAAVLTRWRKELKGSTEGSISSQGFSLALLGMQVRIQELTKDKAFPERRAAAELVDSLLEAL